MKTTGKLLLILTATLLPMLVAAQDNNCIYKQNYQALKGTTLKIFSKYGDINIVTSENDSITVCATISLKHDNQAIIKNSIDLINISFKKSGDTITCETIYDRKFFTASYSKGRRNFSVDYMIRVPDYINVSLRNELGNISIDELSGCMNVNLIYGNLNVKKLTRENEKPVNYISAIQANVEIAEANWLSLDLNHCQKVVIEKAVAVLIESNFSKISTGTINSMVSHSKSDSYNIESIKNLVSESSYSTYILETLTGQVRSSLRYGSVQIEDVSKEFKLIDIISERGIVSIETGNEASFNADISASGTLIDFAHDDFPGITRSENQQNTKIAGTTGINKETQSLIKIKAKSGKLTFRQ